MAEDKKKSTKIKTYQFTWVGVDKKGKEVSGQIEAASESIVKVTLRFKGITVKKVKRVSSFGFGSGKKKKVKSSDVSVFTRQLSTMMKAGVPLIQSFEIVASGHSNPGVSEMLFDIKGAVETGASLSEAFARHPEHFDSLYCNLIAAGEKAGILDMILDRLAVYQEKMQAIKKKIKSAMTYPISVIAIAFIVTCILMIFVVPSFKEVFTSFGAELPAPTQFVMDLSDYFVNNWYIIFGAIAATIFGLSHLLKVSPAARAKRDQWILKMPIFGPIIRKAIIARWARTLATMFSAGVPLVEALTSVAGAANNYVYTTATDKIQKNVETGTSLTVAMQEQEVFPPMMIQMTQIGEESGSLDSMLNKVAEGYEDEVDNAVESLSSLMEPLIIAFLGTVIGGLVVAMYLPIFKMASTV